MILNNFHVFENLVRFDHGTPQMGSNEFEWMAEHVYLHEINEK